MKLFLFGLLIGLFVARWWGNKIRADIVFNLSTAAMLREFNQRP